jgi:hypothetical protein
LNGQNTTDIIVQWGNTGGSVSVIAGNQCGNSNPSVLAVTVASPPSQPAAIQGPDQVCNSATVIYLVDPVPDATSYFWTVPVDATIVSGQNTDSIFVQWGANAGDISIIARNNCGGSTPRTRSIGLETLPGPAGTIAGNDSVCSYNESYIYTVSAIAGATSYTWLIPHGTEITSGTGTNSVVITISPAALSGPVTVQGNNSCGSGTPSSKNITVKTCSGFSENRTEPEISVYPNPAEKVLNIVVTKGEKQMDLLIVDARGQMVYRESLENIPLESTLKVDVSAFSRGVYFMELINSKWFVIKKVILQ